MNADLDYVVIAGVIMLIIVVFVIFYIRNQKDKKDLQEKLKKTDVDLGIGQE